MSFFPTMSMKMQKAKDCCKDTIFIRIDKAFTHFFHITDWSLFQLQTTVATFQAEDDVIDHNSGTLCEIIKQTPNANKCL